MLSCTTGDNDIIVIVIVINIASAISTIIAMLSYSGDHLVVIVTANTIAIKAQEEASPTQRYTVMIILFQICEHGLLKIAV